MPDHYAVLGVGPGADVEAIRAAHRARARVCHPDIGGDERQMMLINEAWRVLRDPTTRAAYDVACADPAEPTAVPDPDGPVILDFGRYQGWRLADVAAIDDDYLAWLERTPRGRPLQRAIRTVLQERRDALDGLRPASPPRRRWAFR